MFRVVPTVVGGSGARGRVASAAAAVRFAVVMLTVGELPSSILKTVLILVDVGSAFPVVLSLVLGRFEMPVEQRGRGLEKGVGVKG